MNLKGLLAYLTGSLVLILVSNGCLSLKTSYTERRSYVLEVRRKGDARMPEAATPLFVSKFRVVSPYGGKGFVYRKDSVTYESDYYNEFFALPSAMLTETARNWLAQSGLFRVVPDSADLSDPMYSLRGSVTALYGDFRESQRPSAVIEIEFSLIREDQDRSQVLYSKRHSERASVRGDSPESLVEGWNQALEKILVSLEADLSKMTFSS